MEGRHKGASIVDATYISLLLLEIWWELNHLFSDTTHPNHLSSIEGQKA